MEDYNMKTWHFKLHSIFSDTTSRPNLFKSSISPQKKIGSLTKAFSLGIFSTSLHKKICYHTKKCPDLIRRSKASWYLAETQVATWPRPKHQSSWQDINLPRRADRSANSSLFLTSSKAAITFPFSFSGSTSTSGHSEDARTVVLLNVFCLPPLFTTVKPSASILVRATS